MCIVTTCCHVLFARVVVGRRLLPYGVLCCSLLFVVVC